MTETTTTTEHRTIEEQPKSKLKNFSGTIAFIICFIIGCMFLYWAVEYWVYNSFDSNRYELSKIQVNGNDTLSIWKLDKRTGVLEYCTKSYDKLDHFTCVRASTIDAKEYTPEQPATPVSTPPDATAPAASTAATSPAVAALPDIATSPATANGQPAFATMPATVANKKH